MVQDHSGPWLSRAAGLGLAQWVLGLGKVKTRVSPHTKARKRVDPPLPPTLHPPVVSILPVSADITPVSEHLTFPGKRALGTGPEPPQLTMGGQVGVCLLRQSRTSGRDMVLNLRGFGASLPGPHPWARLGVGPQLRYF